MKLPKIQEHEKRLRNMLCMVSNTGPVSLHHVMGGSILERIGSRGTTKHSDWLQIPIHYDFHQGQCGIHTIGVKTWERLYGTQAEFIDELSRKLGYDLWALAADERGQKRASRNVRRSNKILARPYE